MSGTIVDIVGDELTGVGADLDGTWVSLQLLSFAVSSRSIRRIDKPSLSIFTA